MTVETTEEISYTYVVVSSPHGATSAYKVPTSDHKNFSDLVVEDAIEDCCYPVCAFTQGVININVTEPFWVVPHLLPTNPVELSKCWVRSELVPYALELLNQWIAEQEKTRGYKDRGALSRAYQWRSTLIRASYPPGSYEYALHSPDISVECEQCHGGGYFGQVPCEKCDGNGRV